MAAVVNKPKPRSLCPVCFVAGVEVDVVFNGYVHKCNAGHSFEDREAFSAMVLEMNKKRRSIEDAQKSAAIATAPAPIPMPVDNRMYVDEIDKQRLESIVGNFGDSATLFGNIFAMNEDVKDLREKLQRAEDRLAISQVRKLGGDHTISIQIPERHVQPIKDIAESGGMTVERYMQAKFEEGLDNLWYY
jgi:hypothetical protein